ncbi:MAG: ribonuclease HI family protein [Chitinivibrionia bacterium]|nr:ribonuclease HI family protein [Chitinivibrionia bacterium]
MNSAEDHLRRLSRDPSFARRFLDLIESLRRGEALHRAAEKASVSSEELDRQLDSIGRVLSAAAYRASESASREAGKAVAKAIVYADGASRGNPGEAACAAVVYDERSIEIKSRAKRLGRATNNVAEYRGVILALELARELGAARIALRLDSELVVKQLNGAYKVKHPGLKPLYEHARMLLSGFARVTIEHVPREKNARADELANAALDGAA